MSTIKSSSEHLTLNADGASKDIKFQANGVEKASISSAGAFTSTTIDATALTGALPAISAASLTNVPAANITGTLPAIDGSNLTGMSGGITEADQWRITANVTSSSDITTNLERVDDTGFGKLGTGMSHTLGWWTFPSTGVWEVGCNIRYYIGSDDNVTIYLKLSTDGGSSYDMGIYPAAGGTTDDFQSLSGRQLVDVTDTSLVKVQFNISSIGTGSYAAGDTDSSRSYFTFIRLGDT